MQLVRLVVSLGVVMAMVMHDSKAEVAQAIGQDQCRCMCVSATLVGCMGGVLLPYFTGCKSTPVIGRPPYPEVSILRFKVFTQRSTTNHLLLLTHQQIAVVGYENPAFAKQSGHWLPQSCIAWNKIKIMLTFLIGGYNVPILEKGQ